MRSEHRPKKKFSQNFLSDEFVIDQIIQAIAPSPEDHLIEIGPGLGAITLPLLSMAKKIDAIELDRDVIPLLENKASKFNNLTVHPQDALTLRLATFSHQPKRLRIVGNLPYHITTPLLFHLLAQKEYMIDMHFMVQKEVAERIVANPGNKIYGRLSVMVQYHCEVEILFDVPPAAFFPAPKVDSAFIRLIPKVMPELVAHNLKNFELVVKKAFEMRRKTLNNALKGIVTRQQLESLAIDPNSRAEQQSVDNFVRISNKLTPG